MFPAAYLQTFPRGGYTVMRARISDGEIVDLDLHVDRLFHSFQLLHANASQSFPSLSKEEIATALRSAATAPNLIRAAILFWNGERAVVESKDFPLAADFPLFLDRALVGAGKPRELCSAKDSQWITSRKPLEDLRNAHKCGELILTENKVLLLEGLTSNLVVITKDGRILTSPFDRVLSGITLRACLKVLGGSRFNLKQPVVFEAPNWNAREEWEHAFICNVNKPGQFVRELVHCETGECKQFAEEGAFHHEFALEMKRYYD